MEKLSPRKIPAKRGGRQYSCPRRPWRCGTAQQLAGWVLAALALANTAPAADSPPVFDAANVQAWADATFKPALARHEFSGLVVSVVRDGQTLFAQGYGRADFASPAPVNPAGTLFRIGSITKTFTATLIAMLIDEGKIGSLDDPANRYLRDYQLPDNDGVAITLIDADSADHGRVYFTAPQMTDLPVVRVELDPDMLATLYEAREGVTIARWEPLRHSLLRPLAELGAGFFWVWPVVSGDRLAAVLSLGYRDAPAADPALARHGAEFADRLSVALSNSARAMNPVGRTIVPGVPRGQKPQRIGHTLVSSI